MIFSTFDLSTQSHALTPLLTLTTRSHISQITTCFMQRLATNLELCLNVHLNEFENYLSKNLCDSEMVVLMRNLVI